MRRFSTLSRDPIRLFLQPGHPQTGEGSCNRLAWFWFWFWPLCWLPVFVWSMPQRNRPRGSPHPSSPESFHRRVHMLPGSMHCTTTWSLHCRTRVASSVGRRWAASRSSIPCRTRSHWISRGLAVDAVEVDLAGAHAWDAGRQPRDLAADTAGVGSAGVSFRHVAGKLHISLPGHAAEGDTLDVRVTYHGHPDDGLILGRNIHGFPTAFADNWPNRARYWFPSIDHPSDKATVAFEVHLSPQSGRRVVANGRSVETNDPSVYRWSIDRPIPTYTMVIGTAGFEVASVGKACSGTGCTEVTTWLFPQDADHGASFRRAADMVAWYSELIAPFPYDKLAHVQSSTRFGGMENVGAIFYPEQSIHEARDIELTVAHETAHQWFGNAVTESAWSHLWLSEGLATYFAALYFEHAEGSEAFREIMERYRTGYLRSDDSVTPIVWPAEYNLFELLNANNYSKGAWVLHMLRRRLGDEAFFEGMRTYYRRHEHGLALTTDLRGALEAVSGASLEVFFDQWVFQPGHPMLNVLWDWSDGVVAVQIRQDQPSSWPTYAFPLDLAFVSSSGIVRHTAVIESRGAIIRLDLPERPTDLLVDPDVDLLVGAARYRAVKGSILV